MNTSHVLPTHRIRLFAITLILASLAAGKVLAQSTDLPNRKDPLEGITTAAQPSAEQLAAAAKSGFKSVIDLRGVNEDRGMDERSTVEKLGMSYVTLPDRGIRRCYLRQRNGARQAARGRRTTGTHPLRDAAIAQALCWRCETSSMVRTTNRHWRSVSRAD